jgi:hypothetical protein
MGLMHAVGTVDVMGQHLDNLLVLSHNADLF